MVLQARQAPVARDLRLLYTVRTVTNHLVRSGTLCEHICRAITETADSERNEDLEATLLEMARAARSVFGEGLDIFRHRDIERARDLQAKDDRVDLLYSEVLNLIFNLLVGIVMFVLFGGLALMRSGRVSAAQADERAAAQRSTPTADDSSEDEAEKAQEGDREPDDVADTSLRRITYSGVHNY
jgi:hypothetical protein